MNRRLKRVITDASVSENSCLLKPVRIFLRFFGINKKPKVDFEKNPAYGQAVSIIIITKEKRSDRKS